VARTCNEDRKLTEPQYQENEAEDLRMYGSRVGACPNPHPMSAG